jgi:hypothetical protein
VNFDGDPMDGSVRFRPEKLDAMTEFLRNISEQGCTAELLGVWTHADKSEEHWFGDLTSHYGDMLLVSLIDLESSRLCELDFDIPS